MFRYVVPFFFLMFAVALLFQRCGPSANRVRNVILISLDTCRADHLSCYGYPRTTTPNIDQLAREGVLFTNVMTPVPLTLPAHCSMLTGTIPPYHGVHTNSFFKLDEPNLTLAEILKQQGFTTAAIISAFVLDSRFGLSQGFDHYNDRFEDVHSSTGINERRGDEVNRFALEWLDHNKSERFFLFLHYFDPHKEYEPPEPFASDYRDDLYAGEIAFTDFCIGQVIDKLKELELYESSMIIVTGDHGEMRGEHGEDGHGYFIYQGAIDVPLICKIPGRIEGNRVDDLVGLIDIVPTVCQVLGIEVPEQVQGESLSRYFNKDQPSGKPSGPERYLYCESLYPSRVGANSLLGVVNDRFKFIQTTRSELYDLIDDPGEKNNLIGQLPQQVEVLEEKLRQILTDSDREDVSDGTMVLDEDSRQRLEALGYITGTSSEMDLEFDQSKEDPKDLIDIHLLTSEGQMLLFNQKLDEAKAKFEEIRKLRPHFHSAYLYLGSIAREQGDFEAAVTYLEEAIRLKPEEPEPHHQLGDILVRLGELDMAVEHFEAVLRVRPEKIETLNNLGFLLTMMGNNDEAVLHLEKALEIDPDEVTALTNLGTTLLKQGKTDEALPHLYRAVTLDAENRRAHVSLGFVLAGKREFDPAIEHLEKALEIAPDQFEVLHELGKIYYHLENIDKALDRWSRALQLNSEHIELLNSLAWIKAFDADAGYHDPEEAVQLALKANELTRYRDASLVNTLATSYAAAGNFPDAVKMAEKCLEMLRTTGPPELIARAKESLELFKAGKTYSETP